MSMRGGFVGRLTEDREHYDLRRLNRRTLVRAAGYLRPYARVLVGAGGATLLNTAAAVLSPYLTKVAVDAYILPGDFSGLQIWFVLFMVVQCLIWLGSYWQSHLANRVGQSVIRDMRDDLFDRLLVLPMRFHDRHSVGELTSRVTHDAESAAEALSSGLVNLLSDLLALVGIAVAMLWLDTQLGLLVLAVVPLAFVAMWWLGQRLRAAYRDVRQQTAAMSAQVEESVAGIRAIQALSQETAAVGRFSQFNWASLRANLRAVILFALVFPAMTVVGAMGFAVVLVFGGAGVIEGRMTLGVLLAFFGYVRRFFGPINELSQVYNTLQAAGAGIERVVQFLDLEPALDQPEQPQRPEAGWQGGVALESVSFAYSDGAKLFDSINLSVEPQETIGIVGSSGAGKSTLARLISRLYEVSSGRVAVDGIDVRCIEKSELGRLISLVPQTPFLFNTTLRDNIAYGRPDAADCEIEEALRKLSDGYVLESCPKGLDTVVGERGVRLSGGQQQLIALTRVFLLDPKVVILDEATSSVDSVTESLIQRALERLLEARTGIIIAHRFSTIARLSRLVVLADGRIVDAGSHAELIGRCAEYQALYKSQWSAPA